MAMFQRFHYDQRLEKCIEFIYGGCGASDNHFLSIEECEDTCKVKPFFSRSVRTHIFLII